MNSKETIYVNGFLSNCPARIAITSPQPEDKEYAEKVFKIWDDSTAIPLKGNMEIELLEVRKENPLVSAWIDEKLEESKGKDIILIKLTDPSPGDCRYTRMLLENWKNYYKPENYLLPNTEIIDIPKQSVDNWMSDDTDPRQDIERLIK